VVSSKKIQFLVVVLQERQTHSNGGAGRADFFPRNCSRPLQPFPACPQCSGGRSFGTQGKQVPACRQAGSPHPSWILRAGFGRDLFMAKSKRIGYAVIGLGHISQRAILPGFRHAKRSKLIALVSGDGNKAKRLAAQFGASDAYTYDALDECLRNLKVEAVYIATPNSMHLEFAVRAAQAGKHVLCEKPLAVTADECRQMIEACHKNGVKLMTAYRKYFEPSALTFKSLIESGKLGRLKIIHTAFTISLPSGDSWHLKKSLAGGGSLFDVGIYCINAVRWMTGLEPIEATAYSWTADPGRFSEVDENMSFQLKFPGSLYMQGSSSFAAAKASFLHVHGEKGWAALDPAYAYNEERRFFGKVAGVWFEKKFKPIDEFCLELDHFSDCIRRNREPEPDGLTGMRDLAVMEAIYEAARRNQPVAIQVPAGSKRSPHPIPAGSPRNSG
jgi:predicted dehydrogenase